jgi:hypothetical protein
MKQMYGAKKGESNFLMFGFINQNAMDITEDV